MEAERELKKRKGCGRGKRKEKGGLNSNGRRRQREKVGLTRARVAGAYTIRDVGSMEVNLFGCRSEPSRGGLSFLGYMFC